MFFFWNFSLIFRRYLLNKIYQAWYELCCLLIPSYPSPTLLFPSCLFLVLLIYYFLLWCSSQGALMFAYLFLRLYQHVSIKNKAPCHIVPDTP